MYGLRLLKAVPDPVDPEVPAPPELMVTLPEMEWVCEPPVEANELTLCA